MNEITEAIVLAWRAGAISDPELLRAIEDAYENDPLVRYMVDQSDPDREDEPVPELFRRQAEALVRDLAASRPNPPKPVVVVAKPDRRGGYVSDHHVVWACAAEDGQGLPILDHSTALPSHRIDTELKTVTLKYAAEDIPLAVARVTARTSTPTGEILGSALVVFRRFPRGRGKFVQVASLDCAALGLTDKQPLAEVWLHVIPATMSNLSEFPVKEVRELRDGCNGDDQLRASAEALVALVERSAK